MNTLFRRDVFSKDTKLSVVREFTLCQLCRSTTNCGEFAHIVALSDKGPRNKHSLIHDGTISGSYGISDKKNCLYLCPNCHTTIDRHPEIYTYKYLNDVKTKHNKIHINCGIPEPEPEPVLEPESEPVLEPNLESVAEFEPTYSRDNLVQTSVKKNQFICFDMNINQCQLCHKQFGSKKAYVYHISRNVCENVVKHICNQCGKDFSSKQMLNYHTHKEVCQKKNMVTVKIEKCDQSTLKIEKCDQGTLKIEKCDQSTLDELRLKVAQLEGENKVLKENPQTIINSNSNNITIIVPPAFLSLDNYEQLTKNLPNLLHNALSKHPANFISYLIKKTNCNAQRPIYNSIKLTNQKSPFIHVSDGEKYVYASKKKTIDELIQNKKDILQEYVDQNGEKYGKQILNRYEKYLSLLDSDKSVKKGLEIDIIVMLLNMSDVIGSDEWSCKLLNDLESSTDD